MLVQNDGWGRCYLQGLVLVSSQLATKLNGEVFKESEEKERRWGSKAGEVGEL